ncbi:MAG: 50S ribosomal protein L2 [Patescibacteria group bacterium]|nr:50S ribosomal protein L2 [Patescibacteria group bacterium]MDD5715372.1 50S ribosomal protein L2 [Patescibacteria group bacterium]
MAIKSYKPTTAGRRGASGIDFGELTKKRPERSLVRIIKNRAGRNAQGKITVRHQGGGHKRFFRMVDGKRERFDEPAKVIALEYDPNRTAWLALVQYSDGEKRYILAPTDLKIGMQVVSSKKGAEIQAGNRLPLAKIPVGITVHDIQLSPEQEASAVRAAGVGAIVQAMEGNSVQIKLPSGEIRIFNAGCMATIGQLSNVDHRNIRLGKAGRMRWRGIRPTVRGKVMNPVDHPHGGGEGHNPIGLKHPKTPWGKPALGVKTRRSGKYSDRHILRRRK